MLTIVHITYHDETNIGSCPIGQTGGFENADGNGEIHCFRIFDGVSVMLMQLEMGSYGKTPSRYRADKTNAVKRSIETKTE